MKNLKIDLNLDKSKKYLIAVSGGPDSMALLDLCFLDGLNFEVIHINYKLRKSADRDQNYLTSYCKKNKIKLKTIINKDKVVGNLQNWARNFRYKAFSNYYKKGSFDALLVAHHQDDLIETYLLKKARKAIYQSVAITRLSIINNMSVIRPLLNHSKKELIDYCIKNKVKFGLDETNKNLKYARNKVRFEVVEEMTQKQREKILKKIENDELKNKIRSSKLELIYKKVVNEDKVNLVLFNQLKQLEKIKILYKFLITKTNIDPKKLSARRLVDYIRQLNTQKPNLIVKLDSSFQLVKSYKFLEVKKIDNNYFEVVIKSFKPKKYKNFQIKNSGSTLQGVGIKKSDLPLTVRSYQNNDNLKIKNGHKKINRLFIDKKVPLVDRQKVPILVNATGEILLVSNYYVNPDRKGLQKNLFVVQY